MCRVEDREESSQILGILGARDSEYLLPEAIFQSGYHSHVAPLQEMARASCSHAADSNADWSCCSRSADL